MVLENSEKEEEDKEESIEKRIGAIIPPNEEEEAIDKEPFYRTVFNIMSLGTTTSVLPISKIPLNISIIMTPVCILITSLANIRSYLFNQFSSDMIGNSRRKRNFFSSPNNINWDL